MNGNKKFLIRNLIVPIEQEINLSKLISKKLGIDRSDILDWSVLKKSIDARKRNHLKFNYTVLLSTPLNLKTTENLIEYKIPQPYIARQNKLFDKNPFIIGSGPSALFAALGFVENGFAPYIFEQGKKMEDRVKDVSDFWKKSNLNTLSNVQFGEGGAGTFSDGKLTSRSQDFYTNKVFEYLVKFGAPESILTDALPHLGTDLIRKIVVSIRNYLISKGTKFFWNSGLEDLTLQNGKITSVKIDNTTYNPEILILALGNSARDTFEMLYNRKILLSSKPFAVGFRIEHPQEYVNKAFYGEKTDFSLTGNATYRLTAKTNGRGVYSFCMCPGGYVVASASEANRQVTNGMSYLGRDNFLANSAIVATVNQDDFGDHVLAGIKFQRKLEERAFNLDFPYYAPAQYAKDFINGKISNKIERHSYKPGIWNMDLNNLISQKLSSSIKFALNKFDKRIKGFIANGVLFGVESRTSSPVRIMRDREKYSSLSADNLFPIGEGAGYSGGIISSAADGYKLSQTFNI